MALSAGSIACQFIKNSGRLVMGGCMFLYSCKTNKNVQTETLPFYNTAAFDAVWIDKEDPNYSNIHTIAPFTLTSQLGHLITKDSLDGHIYVANFFFTVCPGICPKMVVNLHALQDSFANNNQVKLISFSVMPWVDSVAKLKAYGAAHQIDPAKWFLLTGSKEQIYALGRKSYFAEKGLGLQKNETEFLHTESMLLIDKKSRIRGIYNATQKVDMERVSDDIHTLLKE